MTVREMIAQLIEYDMESEIEIVGNNGMEYEVFNDIDLEESYQPSGKDKIEIHFQTEGLTFVNEDELEELRELKDEINELKNELKVE